MNPQSVFSLQQIILFISGIYIERFICETKPVMVLFNNIPYKRMRLTSKVNLTKRFSEKYKRTRLITRLYGILMLVFCS